MIIEKEVREADGKKTFRINFATSLKAVKEEGIIEAYVSIFGNVDSDGDIIVRGAFLESLMKKLPKGVWSHDWDTPVAKTLEAREDEKGLYIKAQFNLDTQRGKEAFSDIKFGIIDEFSIGFRILDWEYDDAGHRIIKKVRLYEWSPVMAGANPDTELVSAKSEAKKDEPKKPEGTPHIINEDDLVANPELIDQGLKVGDEIILPPISENSPAPIVADAPVEENLENIEEIEQGSGLNGGEGDTPAPVIDPIPAPVVEPLEDGKSLKETLKSINNLISALSPLAEKLETALESQGTKVNAQPEALKVFRLKQATKQIDRNAETILRILKIKI